MGKKGFLVLENGLVLTGSSFGSNSEVEGEVVFNTGMVGYPEGYTDPSYYGQILVQTYPLIGNYGVPSQEKQDKLSKYFESSRIQIRGLIVSQYIDCLCHWQAKTTLAGWLKSQKIPALSGIDTRTLTKMLREKGVMKGAIIFKPPPDSIGGFSFKDINEQNLVTTVSLKKPVKYGRGKIKILLFDCGVKNNIIRWLIKKNTTVYRVPWDYNPFGNGQPFNYRAVVISNGPGNPKMADKTIAVTKKIIDLKIPTFGICLGNQIMALAIGADTYKLKYGHRGQNQPVIDETTKKCFVTTQNHGFAVASNTLPSGWRPWFTNLNDQTNEGIRHEKLPFISSQFHPEATPGPNDANWLFDYFINLVNYGQNL